MQWFQNYHSGGKSGHRIPDYNLLHTRELESCPKCKYFSTLPVLHNILCMLPPILTQLKSLRCAWVLRAQHRWSVWVQHVRNQMVSSQWIWMERKILFLCLFPATTMASQSPLTTCFYSDLGRTESHYMYVCICIYFLYVNVYLIWLQSHKVYILYLKWICYVHYLLSAYDWIQLWLLISARETELGEPLHGHHHDNKWRGLQCSYFEKWNVLQNP